MSNEIHPVNSKENGGYERRDIGVAGVLYFLAGLALGVLLVYLIADRFYSYLEKRSDVQQAPVSPLVTNAPADTRKLSTDYKDYLKSAFADLANVGGRWGGAITAAMFLKEFAGDTPWVHLDIAGTAWLDDEKPYLAKGPTGVPVRTLVRLAADWK